MLLNHLSMLSHSRSLDRGSKCVWKAVEKMRVVREYPQGDMAKLARAPTDHGKICDILSIKRIRWKP